jgi:predicted metal-dependent phosphoesterase TrpH
MNKGNCGAEWVRDDLHLHSTGEDFFRLSPGINLNSEEDKRKIIRACVEKFKQTKLKFAANTDYNGIKEEWFNPIKEEAKKEGTVILPGAELNISKGRYSFYLIGVLNDDIYKRV